MAIQSASDHGYSAEPRALDVRLGDKFRTTCGIGISEWRVARRHRDAGYYETVFERWVTAPDHPSRNSAKGGIQIRSRAEILQHMHAA